MKRPAEMPVAPDALARRLAARSPIVNREIKRMVYDASGHRFPRATRMEAASLVVTLTSRRARKSIGNYNDWLTAHPNPTDDAITSGFEAAASG